MREAKGMKLSVIVGVYNPPLEKFTRCLESIINQTYSNLEIILLDDGSSNGAERICDEYGKRDGRVRVLHQQNYGTHAKFHIGYTRATGDYITNADHDDYLELDCYERLMEIANDRKVDVVDSGYHHHDWRTKKVSQKFVDTYFEIEGQKEIVISTTNGKVSTETWCKIFKRSLAKQGEQWLLADPLTFIDAQTFIHIPYAGYHFVNTESSVSSNRLSSWHIEQLERQIKRESIAATLEVFPYLSDYLNNSRIAWLERCYYYSTRTTKPVSSEEEILIARLEKHLKYDKEASKSLPLGLRIRYFAVTHRLVFLPYKLVSWVRSRRKP
ncbi:MAG: glycosyltransferase family 2 protein [Eggerthellaceae bacterium]|nr:glycosyltransferase family 2 protein [Eggerthellaceae bacterium]